MKALLRLVAIAVIVASGYTMAANSSRSRATAAQAHWFEMPGGSWNPSSRLLGEIESTLKRDLPAASVGRGDLPSWDAYTLQYRGERSLTLRRYVRINAFCDSRSSHPRWHREWVVVYDGGACFFSARFDPESDRLYDLEVNGIG